MCFYDMILSEKCVIYEWKHLEKCVYNVEHPLSAFDKLDQFKLVMFDTGLLKHMAGFDNSAILLKTDFQRTINGKFCFTTAAWTV